MNKIYINEKINVENILVPFDKENSHQLSLGYPKNESLFKSEKYSEFDLFIENTKIHFIKVNDDKSILNKILSYVKNQKENVELNLNYYKVDRQFIYQVLKGYLLSSYNFTKINQQPINELSLNILSDENKDLSDLVNKAYKVAESIYLARDLGNMPSNMMTPSIFAEKTQSIANELGIDCIVYGKDELVKMGAGALLAVSQGSSQEPKLIELKYVSDSSAPLYSVVGKGITFDSGGYNLKTNGGAGMKYDMCGAANALGTFVLAVKLGLKINLQAVIPLTENMINGKGYKIGDVFTSLSGKTIEITNTDAEGRLILADAITYACKNGANYIIDMATLTGAVVGALASEYTGCFTNDQSFLDELKKASIETNENIWQLPICDAFEARLMKSEVADIINSAQGGAGASIAACFLKYFVEEKVSWIHLDIAATSTSDGVDPCYPKGASGVMIETIIKLLENCQ